MTLLLAFRAWSCTVHGQSDTSKGKRAYGVGYDSRMAIVIVLQACYARLQDCPACFELYFDGFPSANHMPRH